MDTQTIFHNEDIVSEVLKHISVDSFKDISLVSKKYNSYLEKISDIDYVSRKYKESYNLTTFISETCKTFCKKYNYKTPKFIYTLCIYLDNNVSEKDKNAIKDDIYLIYYWIIILLHSVNNNYKEIVRITKKINYKNKVKNTSIIHLFMNVMKQPNYKIFGRCYSNNKYKFIRHISIAHIILVTKNQVWAKISPMSYQLAAKQKELINGIIGFEILPNRWLFPKTFCLELIDILDK